MPSGAKTYRRLPGRQSAPFSVATLWLAADHLLLAEVQGYTETYRRIYLRDIQALVVRRTHRRAVWTVILGVPALLLAALTAGQPGGWRIFWSVPLVFVVTALAINVLRGPACRCQVFTPLGPVEVGPLRRLRWARQAIAVLRPHIETEQGTLPIEDLVERAFAAEQGATRPAPSPGPARLTPPPLVRPGGVVVHTALCAALCLDAVVTGLQISNRNAAMDSVATFIYFAALACALVAVVAQAGTDLGRGLTRFAWGAFVFLAALIMVTIGHAMVRTFLLAMARAGPAGPPTQADSAWVAVENWQRFSTMAPVEMAGDLILATWGLVLLLRRRSAEGPWKRLKISP